ncbi:MAG: peptidylprolyl isomerase [Pseudomonadota bacterium]
MKTVALTMALGGALLLLSGCKGENGTAPPPVASVADSEVVATVNGTPISRTALETLSSEVAARSRGAQIPREKLIEELIHRELLVQEAEKKQLANTPEVIARIDSLKRSVLSQAAVEDFFKNNEIADEDLKKEYDKRMGALQKTEYKARHILSKTEDEAKKVIAKLEKGGAFAELAKKHSTGPSSANGGDLGWFTPQQMVTPFSETVIALKNGEYTKAPVKTKFGWHVILREDSRDQTPPPFESIKEQLKPLMQREKLQSHLAELRKQAKVEILETEPAQEKPAEESEEIAPVSEDSKEEPPASEGSEDMPGNKPEPASAAEEETAAPAESSAPQTAPAEAAK